MSPQNQIPGRHLNEYYGGCERIIKHALTSYLAESTNDVASKKRDSNTIVGIFFKEK
jgi:hypothetical protein